MLKKVSQVWLSLPSVFDPVQLLFNGSLWEEVGKKFKGYTKGNILDLACGTGEFRKCISPKSYLGIDINPHYIDHAKKRFSLPHTKFLHADATKFITKEKFDVAFLISAAHHLSDLQLKNLCQTAKKNNISCLIIIDDLPLSLFSLPLRFLDYHLGGGKYFRSNQELENIINPYFKIRESSSFSAKFSFYYYPYLIADSL